MRPLPSVTILLALALAASACDRGDERMPADATKPKPAKPDATEPTHAAGDPTLTIVEGKSGIEMDGAFVVIRGELHNGSDAWLSAAVDVDLLDASGKPIAVDSIQSAVATDLGNAAQERVIVERDVIPPGESSPFEYIRDTTKLAGTYAKHTLVGRGRPVSGVGRAEIVEFGAKYEFGFVVSGKARGTTAEPCEDPAVVVVLRDAQGTIVEVGGAPLMDGEYFVEKLAEGQLLPFEITVGGEARAKPEALVRCEAPD